MQLHAAKTQNVVVRDHGRSPWVLSKSSPQNLVEGVPEAGPPCRVLIVDRDPMSSDLLSSALERDRHYHASAVPSADLLRVLAANRVDVVVIGADLNQRSASGYDLAAAVRRTHPDILIVILLNESTRDAVIHAFRSGARGVFSRERPVADFIACVDHVSKGYLWASEKETDILLDAFRSIPSPYTGAAPDAPPLTARELQVVQCAARGMTNKTIANELGLSEHTVKNYLFRAFDKLGVSNRVELLFYLTVRGHSFDSAPAEVTSLVATVSEPVPAAIGTTSRE